MCCKNCSVGLRHAGCVCPLFQLQAMQVWKAEACFNCFLSLQTEDGDYIMVSQYACLTSFLIFRRGGLTATEVFFGV